MSALRGIAPGTETNDAYAVRKEDLDRRPSDKPLGMFHFSEMYLPTYCTSFLDGESFLKGKSICTLTV